jgi:heme-degrading monooxygenase HmoA
MFFARVMSTNLKRQSIDEAIAEWRTHIEPFKANGMSKAYMFVDRATGKYLSITIWQSEVALERNSISAGQTKGRRAMTEKYFESPPTPSTFEVVDIIE